MQMVDRAQPLDRGNVAHGRGRYRQRAGTRRLAVEQHGASAALRKPAAELRTVQFQVIAQDVQQWRVGLYRRDASGRSVHPQGEISHDLLQTTELRQAD